MTSDHQSIDTMHTPLPNQQQVNSKDLHKVCNDMSVLSVAENGCHQPSSVDQNVTQNVANCDNSEMAAASGTAKCMPTLPWWFGPNCDKRLGTTNGLVAFGDDDEDEDEPTLDTGTAINKGLHLAATENTGGSHFMSNGNTEHQNVDARNFLPNSNSSRRDQAMLPSPFSVMDGQGMNGASLMPAADGLPSSQASAWPGYDVSYDDLITRVRHQLEFYFSRENLAGDAYLRSQMDNDQFVKVAIISNFNMIKRLTTDMDVILQAIRESPYLQLDETGEKVRPIHKRCTLILREIPDGTEQKEVEDLFSSPACPKIIGCEYALNNMWYVNFEADEDAQKAFLYLRQQVQSFKGKPILARIKTAPIPRVQNGYRPVPPSTLSLQNPQQPMSNSLNDATHSSVSSLLSPAYTPALPLSLSVSSIVTTGAAANVMVPATPGDNGTGCVIVNPNAVTLACSVGLPPPNIPPSNIYYCTTGTGQPTAIVAAATGHAPTVVAAPAAAAVISPTWPPAGPASFDLGYILAVNGYQTQGAYRPALLLPATSIPAQVAAAVGHRFVAERSGRKLSRSSANYNASHNGDRAANNADNGRPTSYNHYGSSAAPSRTGGSFNEGRATYYRNDQNIHYNSIRNRPGRQSANGGASNSTGSGSRKYVTRSNSERYSGADYWKANTKDRKATGSGTASGNVANSKGASCSSDCKRSDGFDLQSSSFPPLPTSTVAEPSETTPPVISANADARQTHVQQDNHRSEKSSCVGQIPPTSPSSTKVHPCVQQRLEYANGVEISDSESKPCPSVPILRARDIAPSESGHNRMDCSSSVTSYKNMADTKATLSFPQDSHTRADQKPIFKSTSSVAVRAGISSTIPVAVVSPSAQPKAQRVATADKATGTDSFANTTSKKTVAEERNSVATMTSNPGDPMQVDEKVNCDIAKRLSYADMAKHAPARNCSTVGSLSTALGTIEKTDGTSNADSSNGFNEESRDNFDDGGRRRQRNGNVGANSNQSRSNYAKEPQTKYNSSRKQSRPYRNRGDHQQQREHAASSYHASSPPPSMG